MHFCLRFNLLAMCVSFDILEYSITHSLALVILLSSTAWSIKLIYNAYDDAKGLSSGSAYVYTRIDNTWSLDSKIVLDDGKSRDYVGTAVDIYDHTLVIGADDDDECGSNSSSVHVRSLAP